MRLTEFFLLDESRDRYYTVEPHGSTVELRAWERANFFVPDELDDEGHPDHETSYERMSSTTFEQALSLLRHELDLAPAEEELIRRAWEQAQDSGDALHVERRGDDLSIDFTVPDAGKYSGAFEIE